ncbi:carbonyl reductase [NADPH] 1-like [Ruditapes philippinarum]|uniref:carbonyl reductase [NADPH] 1-like n=1 Tax=Ruditapes philippinarum TaxID=129788 RepID=UPI00295B7746|nr:carbonyl reductase [NADPH] 1-like [Ruditapes philippinarum]
MSASKRVAVVTGANKGIGYAIVRGLCKQFDGDVILTGRSESRGQEAIKQLNGEGLKPLFHQLDLDDVASIDRLKTFLQTTYSGLDILVNNAGIAFKMAATEPFAVQAEITVATNFWGTLNVCKKLFPLLRPHARVVNVSSGASNMAAKKCSSALNAKFLTPDLDVAKVEQMMTEFVNSAKDGTFQKKGWCESAYGCSKIGVTLLSFAQQKEFDNDSRPDIIVNACCPGYVDTDMSSHKGTRTIDEGADTPIYLSLLPENASSPKGKFLRDRKVLSWP